METTVEYGAGELAYVDSFAGLVPCRVVAVEADRCYGGGAMCTVVLTATRGAYRRGERVWVAAGQVIPRAHVRVSSGQFRIRGGFRWVA